MFAEGGVFVPTQREYRLGDDVYVLLTLPDEPQRYPVAGRVAWIDLLEAARARPGQLNYGSGGVGSSQHLAGASFKQLTGVDVTHIPYKGTAPAMTDLMAGRVDFVLTTGAIPFIRSGKLRALAVASRQRLPALPEVPTFEEAGVKGFYTD